MKRSNSTSLCLLLTVYFQLHCCRGGSHYCHVGFEPVIDLSIRVYQDERLIGKLFSDEAWDESEKPVQCSWLLTARYLALPRQLVLIGMPGRKAPAANEAVKSHNLLRCHFEEPEKCNGTDLEVVNQGMFQVFSLSSRNSYVSVSVSLNPRDDYNWSPVVLRAVMPQVGFCNRDMLSFKGRCYAISPVADNVTTTISNIKGDVRLASFSSFAEIDELVAENKARRKAYPFKRPLDLSQRVRIGLFYRAKDEVILTVQTHGCNLEPFSTQDKMKIKSIKGQCGYLILPAEDSDQAIVEFGDCSRPMLALLSFPEIPSVFSTKRCEECSDRHSQLVQTLLSSQPTEFKPTDGRQEKVFFPVLFLPPLLIVVFTILLLSILALVRQVRSNQLTIARPIILTQQDLPDSEACNKRLSLS